MPYASAVSSVSSSSSTALTFSSSRRMSSNWPRPADPATTTVSFASGSRTRSFSFLRRAFDTDDTSRTASIAARMSSATGNAAASGQSVRCTLRRPVSPCHTRSDTSGMRGAATRHSVSSTV